MQLARRLPGPASRFVGHALGRCRVTPVGLLPRGCSEKRQRRSHWSPVLLPSRLLGEIALNLGISTPLIDSAAVPPHRRSRISGPRKYRRGDRVLPDGKRRKRLSMSESRCTWLVAGHRAYLLPVPHFRRYGPSSSLHVLTNSLPHTRSGYAYRSPHPLYSADADHQGSVTRPPIR